MPDRNSKNALRFVTEYACCLVQATGRGTDNFRTCSKAAEYLADGDESEIMKFRIRTCAVNRDPTGNEDYDTEQYVSKEYRLRAAVTTLNSLGKADETPNEIRGVLLEVSDFIADFYGLDETEFPVNIVREQ